jgi:2-phosphosulfolactate phosphatase
MGSPFEQDGFRCRLDWGRHGTQQAAERGDVLVIVDTLSFSTAAVTAVEHGGILYPCTWDEDAEQLARAVGGEAAVRRQDVPMRGRFSLSPLTFLAIEAGTRVVLPSPNGATCSRYGRVVPHLLVGALVNARAVGAAVTELLEAGKGSVTVLCCGERWEPPTEDGALRFAIEDYLAAGAILASIPHEKSPEARICEAAFQNAHAELPTLLWECGSGRELRAKGFPEDVRHAAQLDLYDAVPVMRDGWLRR